MTGVALQAAALDMHLNAWEHMDLQAALQGIPKASAGSAARSCSSASA